MEEVPAFPTPDFREVDHSPYPVVFLALDHIEEGLADWKEQHRHEERHDLGQDDQRERELELLLGEGVAHVNDVDHDQQDYEDEEVQDEQKGPEWSIWQVVRHVEFAEKTTKTVEAVPAVPGRDDQVVEGEGHDLQVVQAGLEEESS